MQTICFAIISEHNSPKKNMLNRRTMPLAGLRAFESTGRHLHMGKAGQELGVTHGAISHQVRALEKQLGIKLFSRANRKLRLTGAGRQLLVSVSNGFDCFVEGSLHLDPSSMAGPLVIGCTQMIGASWALRYFREFQLSYPQTEIHLVEIQPRQKEIPAEVEVAFCYGEPLAPDRLVRRMLTPPLYPVGSPRILHTQPTVTHPDQLAHFRLLHDSNNSWSDWFSTMGATEPVNASHMHFFNTVLAINAARQGLGVALCNSLEIENELRDGQLVKLFDQAIPESSSYYLVTDHPGRQTLRARLFAEWIDEDLTGAAG